MEGRSLSLVEQVGERLATSLSASLPSILSALAVLLVGALAARLLGRAAEAIARNAALPDPRPAGRLARTLVWLGAGLLAADRLGFGRSIAGIILLVAFSALLLALALAFGLGAVSLARRKTEKELSGLRPGLPRDDESPEP